MLTQGPGGRGAHVSLRMRFRVPGSRDLHVHLLGKPCWALRLRGRKPLRLGAQAGDKPGPFLRGRLWGPGQRGPPCVGAALWQRKAWVRSTSLASGSAAQPGASPSCTGSRTRTRPQREDCSSGDYAELSIQRLRNENEYDRVCGAMKSPDQWIPGSGMCTRTWREPAHGATVPPPGHAGPRSHGLPPLLHRPTRPFPPFPRKLAGTCAGIALLVLPGDSATREGTSTPPSTPPAAPTFFGKTLACACGVSMSCLGGLTRRTVRDS